MGRYYYDKKNTVEESRRISMGRLRGWDYLKGFVAGRLSWKDGWGNESRIGITVITSSSSPRMQLNYTVTKYNGEKKDYDYSVELMTSPCRFGGKRYWFVCPLVKSGLPCRRRISVLYCPPGGGYYGCRHCHDLTYSARQEHNHRFAALGKMFDYEKRAETLYTAVKREHYRGKPTKKYQRFLRYSTWLDTQAPILTQQMKDLL